MDHVYTTTVFRNSRRIPMKKGIKEIITTIFSSLILTPIPSYANNINPVINSNIFQEAKQNDKWKSAFLTGKHAQIVFMNVTTKTNPNNEIGMETHKFDQIIFVVEGQAKSILNGKESIVKEGDMIFIPEGTAHNFVNLSKEKPFKILSVYSNTDIPAGSIYKKKSDAHE